MLVIFAVKEKPSVRKILISGNDELDLDKINEVLDLKRDAILDVTKIKQNREKIHDLYVEKGFYLAAVEYEVKPVNESEVDVWFVVNEHSKVEIRDVSFIGNRRIPDADLAGVIGTRRGGAMSFLTDSGIYQEEQFERDLLIITAYYYDRGFINVKLGTPQIRLSRDKKYMYVSIPIDEGPVFDIGSINFKGDLIGPREDYYERLTIKPGEVFNRSKVSEDINKLNDYYKDKGYAYVNITPVTNVNLKKLTVGLDFEIEKGKKVYFERINIRGNSKTRDKVIRREMKISEGELYNQTKLDDSKRYVTALGYFEKVDVSTKRGSSDEFIEVNVEVAERPTGTFQIGAGFSSVENFIAQAQISQNNLFGRGQTLALQAQLSSLRQLFLLRFIEPWFLDTRWTFAFDLFNQSRAFSSDLSRNSSGGNLTWGYPINDEIRGFVTYKLEDVSVSTGQRGFANIGSIREPIEAQFVANLYRGGFTSSVRGMLQYDSRNNRLFTTDGAFHHALRRGGRRLHRLAERVHALRRLRPLLPAAGRAVRAAPQRRGRRHGQPRSAGRADHRALPHRRHLRRARLPPALAGPGPAREPAGRRRPAARRHPARRQPADHRQQRDRVPAVRAGGHLRGGLLRRGQRLQPRGSLLQRLGAVG